MTYILGQTGFQVWATVLIKILCSTLQSMLLLLLLDNGIPLWVFRTLRKVQVMWL